MPCQPDCLHDEVTAMEHEGCATVEGRVDVVYLSFSRTFGTVSLNILPLKLGHYSLDGWTNRWAKHELDDEAERAVVKGSYPTWRPVGHTGAL